MWSVRRRLGKYGRMARPAQAPTRSWWLLEDFYGEARKEASRIMTRDRSFVKGEM